MRKTVVGVDLGTPVVEAIGAERESRFTGSIPTVTIEVHSGSPSADAAVEEALELVKRRIE